MAILRLLVKILLMPIVFVLITIKWLIGLIMRFTASIVGLSLILVTASIIYCVISLRWQEMFIFVLSGGCIIGLMFMLVIFQEVIDYFLDIIGQV